MLRTFASTIRLRAPLRAAVPGGNISFIRLQTLHTTARRSDAVGESHRGAEQETREIIALDKLLRLVQQRSDPAARAIMPVRSPGLYAESLLKASAPTHSPSTSTSSQAPDSSSPPPKRAMHDSYSEVSLPLRSNATLFEQFINANGGIRTGKLMEHLDALAGSIAYKHILGSDVQSLGRIEDRGLYVVTAAVDRIDMLRTVSTRQSVADLRISGNVIYTGRSSMEIAVKMEALHPDAESDTLMIGRFSMVCRDAVTHKARAVGALSLTTEDERQLFAYGQGHQKRKKDQSLTSLDIVPPSSEEAKILHDFYLANGRPANKADGSDGVERISMKSTRLQNCFMMFPQERNVHGKVFGGHLMRLAYEIGFTNSSLFAHRPVRFLSLDEINFKRPVNIGSIVRLSSVIAHTARNERYPLVIHVKVQADVIDVATGSSYTTNDFRFTWAVEPSEDDAAPSGELVTLPKRTVVPRTYEEAMLWLEARRDVAVGDEIRGLRTSDYSPFATS